MLLLVEAAAAAPAATRLRLAFDRLPFDVASHHCLPLTKLNSPWLFLLVVKFDQFLPFPRAGHRRLRALRLLPLPFCLLDHLPAHYR